ncbi:MAG: PAS domain-containing protein [Gammaproteobacteria bacterium]
METKLLALQQSFKEQLPVKISNIESLWDKLVNGDTSDSLIFDMHRIAHSLSGSGGSFGAVSLSAVARELEQTLQPLLEIKGQKLSFSSTLQERINELLKKLNEIADAWQPSETLNTENTYSIKQQAGNLIYVVTNVDCFDVDLAAALDEACFHVIHFLDLDEFAEACKKENPALVIICITSDNHSEDQSFLSELQSRIKTSLPILLVSDRNDIESRLSAVRSGIQHYFTLPLNVKKLINYLDDLMTQASSKLRVLLIDDDDILLKYHATLLTEAGMDIKTISNPMACLEILDEFQPNLIVTDVYMPGCSGPELTQVIRQDDKWSLIPIIYLSTESDLDRQLMLINNGGDDFLTKPVEPKRLVSTAIARAKQSQKFSLLNNKLRNTLRENKFQLVTMNQHDIVSTTDLTGRIISVNDKFCAISGYSRDELLGQNHRLLKSGYHPKSFYEDMWNTISHGNVWHGAICNRSKDGNEYWVESTIVPFLDNHGKPYKYVSARTDITSLRLNEKRLHRSQMFANIGTWDWNIKTGEVYWSEKIGPLFGISSDNPETTYEKFLSSIYPDDREMVSQAINDCVTNGNEYNVEHRVVWPNGEVRWVQEKGDVIRSEDGEPLHMLGVVQDIHSRKIAEIALAEHEIQLLEAQSLAHLGNWQADLRSGELTWSEEIYSIFGYQPGQIEPSVALFQKAVHPDDLELVNESIARAGETGIHDVVHRIIRQDGEIRYVHELARADIDTEGKLAGLKGTVQDITETYAMQEQLEQQQKLLNTLHQVTTNFVESRDFSDATKNMLDTLLDITGSEYGFTGEIFYDENNDPYLVTHAISDISWNNETKSLIDKHKEHGIEFHNLESLYGHVMTSHQPVVSNNVTSDPRSGGLPKGHPPLNSFLGVPIFHGNELVGMYGIANRENGYDEKIKSSLKPFDTTYGIMIHSKRILEREEQNRVELIQAMEEAENANRAKSKFLSSMSHELRTPMNAIMGFAQLINMDTEQPLTESQQEDIDEILKAGKHLLELINEVLDLSKIESGKIKINLQRVLVNDVIQQCLPLVSTQAVERGISIVDNINGKAYGVFADPIRLKQIILNLLSNAVKYNTEQGCLTLDSEVINNNRLRISISDTGKGLEEEEVERLFIPFERLNELENIEGAGIGLVITKNLIELMNGNIGVKSKPGKGSTFWIELAIADMESDNENENVYETD